MCWCTAPPAGRPETNRVVLLPWRTVFDASRLGLWVNSLLPCVNLVRARRVAKHSISVWLDCCTYTMVSLIRFQCKLWIEWSSVEGCNVSPCVLTLSSLPRRRAKARRAQRQGRPHWWTDSPLMSRPRIRYRGWSVMVHCAMLIWSTL